MEPVEAGNEYIKIHSLPQPRPGATNGIVELSASLFDVRNGS